MSETMPTSPTDAAAKALGEGAKSMARDAAMRQFRRTAKRYVPRMFHPLIPGVKGSVEANAKKKMRRWISGLIFSIVFFIVFFGLVGGVLLFAGITIALSLM